MGGLFSAGGLITGIDSNTLIQQLLQLERGPIIRIEDRIEALESERDAARDFRTQLVTLRNRTQDFRFNNTFDAFLSTSSDEAVLTSEVSSATPVTGSFDINVTQLASATAAESSAVLGATIDPDAILNSSGIVAEITGTTFSINGVQFTFDPAIDSLNTVLSDINASTSGVTGTFDSGNNIVNFVNSTASDTSIVNFKAQDDDSNFLDVIAVTTATQFTGTGGTTEINSSNSLGVIDSLAVLDTVSFTNGAITSGSFSINGVSISVDPTTDSLGDIIAAINSSGAQVNASFDGTTDTIRVLSTNLGSRTVNFGGTSDTSNFLSITNLDTATQTAGNDLEFTVNGGTTQTRNTNEISDAVTGVTLRLLSTGTSTVTVNSDNDSIVETVQEFIDEFNNSVGAIRDLLGTEGALRGDSGIRSIENFLRANIFSPVADLGGDLTSLLDIGISTGQDFDSSTPSVLELDEDAFREELRDDRTNVEELFSNTDGTGIADILFDFVDEITRTTGFLNARSKAGGSVDTQIRSLNDQIDRIEDRLLQKEDRLRRQFTRLEQLSAGFQNQSAALSGFSFSKF